MESLSPGAEKILL